MTQRRAFPTSLRMVFLIGLLMAQAAFAQVSVHLSSRFLARGEYARFEVTTSGREADRPPIVPTVPNVTIDFGRQGMVGRGNTMEFAYVYILSSYEVGKHVIPPIDMMVGGSRVKTPPLEFWVFDPSELPLSELKIGDFTMTYYATFQASTKSPYEGETLDTEIKIYVPLELESRVEDWGIPEFERDNVTSWRFEPNDIRGRVNILGKPHAALAYPSTMTPSKAGKVGIGPATVRLTASRVSFDGYPRTNYEELFLKIPKLEMDAKPLPPGAPAGFENAIGQFQIQSTMEKIELSEGESLAVNLAVKGNGNLDTLHAPKLADTNGWKVYNPISIPRGDERRKLSGTAMFHQGLLPLEMKQMVPPFELVYFDPEDGAYKTASSEPIPIVMLPSTQPPGAIASGPPPSGLIPMERMTDILALMNPSQLTLPTATSLPAWTGHAIGGLLALLLLVKAAWMRITPKLKKDPIREAKVKELSEFSRIPATDDVTFLKATGAFVERWHGKEPPAELEKLLEERDRVCFRPDKAAAPLPRGRREEILRTLRKATLALAAVMALALAPKSEAANIQEEAEKAFNEAHYEEAIKLWQSAGDFKDLSPEVLYNIGNASYRMGSPGHAALYFRRALVKDIGLEEARQNLRFIERKYGSISVQYSDFQYALAKIPLNGWKAIFWGGIWIVALSLLVFPATRPGARVRVAAAILLVLGPLVISAGALGWKYFPNDSIFAPLENQAVIVAPGAVLYADAARTAPEVIDAPPGSLCEIVRVTGKWAYVSFASKTRGWIPVKAIEKLVPDSAPGVPKVLKPETDDSNA